MIVLDASVTVSWLLKESASTEHLDNLLINQRVFVPAHWSIEVRHAILKALRRKQISENRLDIIASDLSSLDLISSPQLMIADVIPLMNFARQHGLTMYDAGYMKLAIERSAALATLDSAVRQTAEKLGVRLAL